MSIIKTPEDEFIQELEGYLDIKFDKYSLSKITGLLGNYRNSLPEKSPMIIKQDRIIFRPFKSRDIVPPNADYKTVSPMEIINKILDATGITLKELTGKDRQRKIIIARHIAMYMIRDICGLSTLNIGKIFNRDHTTVMHATSNVMNMIDVGSEQFTRLIGYVNYHLAIEEKKSA